MGESFGKVINDYGKCRRSEIAELKALESECDVKKHKILGQLNESFITPFDREDIVLIADQLDDIADYMEDIANKFVIYDVKVLREDAVEMGNIIVESTLHVKIIFDELADSKKSDATKTAIVEINRLEDLADAIFDGLSPNCSGKRKTLLKLSDGTAFMRARTHWMHANIWQIQ